MRTWAVTGLGFGDEGKGSTVEWLCDQNSDVDVVVRHNGGGQAAHTVVYDTIQGIHHTFAQLGSGSFNSRVKTVLSRHMLVNPVTWLVEADVFESKGPGLRGRVFVDPRAIVTTPYHVQLNRAREYARGVARHGTTGMGISETVLDSLARPDRIIRCGDCTNSRDIRTMLGDTRRALMPEMERLGAQDEFNRLDIGRIADQFMMFAERTTIDADAVKHVLQTAGGIVFEGAQGMLLHEDYGFHPHTTWSRTGKENAVQVCSEYALPPPRMVGVTRTYHTRHGQGPFPTEQYPSVYAEPHNGNNGMAGQFRVGSLDMSLLRYAIECAGGIDDLVVNHADVHPDMYCPYNPGFVHESPPTNLREQERLTRLAWTPVPADAYRRTPPDFPHWIATELDTPLLFIGKGPGVGDKVCP
jgi:adenylosuccinate synthase